MRACYSFSSHLIGDGNSSPARVWLGGKTEKKIQHRRHMPIDKKWFHDGAYGRQRKGGSMNRVKDCFE